MDNFETKMDNFTTQLDVWQHVRPVEGEINEDGEKSRKLRNDGRQTETNRLGVKVRRNNNWCLMGWDKAWRKK